MQFIVYGAGAIGGVLGARLHLSGYDVQLVARGGHLAEIRKRGLRLQTPGGESVVRVRAAERLTELPATGPDTVVLVCVKGQQTAAVLADLAANAHPGITVVAVQNGVANERALLREFARVLAVNVQMPATHLEPGAVVQHCDPVAGLLDIGGYPGGVGDRAEDIAEAFRTAGFDSVVRPDVMAWKYRKLIVNLGNAVTASCRPGTDADRLVQLLRDEGTAVLTAAGIEAVSQEQDLERRGDLLNTNSRGGGSTWQSLTRGTGDAEVDYLNGEIVLLGRLHDVPTPANELLRRTVQRLARQHAEPASLAAADLLAELAQDS